MNDDIKNGFDLFLTDNEEMEENVGYIKPDIELQLSPEKRKECREIIQEIKKYGASSQRQILYLIYLLSLEIENTDTMKSIVNACKVGRKELKDEKKIIIPE